jgi:hypothetical protein
MRIVLLVSATVLAMEVTPTAIHAAKLQAVVLQAPMWGCPTVYQAASWETRERCILVKPPAIGRWLDALSVQGNDYVKVALNSGKTLWFSAVPKHGPWQTWQAVPNGEDLNRAAAEAAAHTPPAEPMLPEPTKFELTQHEVDQWKAKGIVARMTPVSFKAEIPAWVCVRIDNARAVEDAVARVRTMKGEDAKAATRMLNDAVAGGDCWLMDKGTEGLDLGTTIDGEFRNVWLSRFPYGAPVIMLPNEAGIGGWTAIEKHP